MHQGHIKQSASLPFHITTRHRKFKMFYQQLHQHNQPVSLESMIDPITRAKKKLPVSGECAQRIRQNRHKKTILQTDRIKRNKHELSQLLKRKQDVDEAEGQNGQNLPNYLRLKQIKRKNSMQSNGSAYVKQTDEQLQQRVKQFIQSIQSKRLKAKKKNLLEKGEYEKRLLDSQIIQCQKTIIQNQRMMERQARVQQRLKCLKRGRIMVDKYQLQAENESGLIQNSVNLRSKLPVFNSSQSKTIQKLKRQSLNLSKLESRNQRYVDSQQRRLQTEPDELAGQESLQHYNQQMLKKLITLVKKKQRLNCLSNSLPYSKEYQ